MPITCAANSSVLTGADGLVEFSPAGTNFCLVAADFPAGTDITVPASSQYQVGDSIAFSPTGAATLDTGMGGSTIAYVTKVLTVGAGSITVEDAASPGTALTLTGDTATTGGDHIEVLMYETLPVCSVQEWSLSLTKETTDVTTLPCSVGTGGAKVAPVRKQQGTFLSGEGSMSILFTADQTSMGQRLLGNSVLTDSKVYSKLYVNAVAGAGGVVDDATSSYYEGWLNLLGFEITVNTSDAIVATVNFSLADSPKALCGVTL